MGIWNWGRKKQTVSIESKCDHKWKDFPWYVQSIYCEDKRKFNLKIIEPYVCIHCKERKDVVLHEVFRTGYSWDDAFQLIDDCHKKYGKFCEDRPIVEDMINDMQLVDRQYLEIAEKIYPEKFGKLIRETKEGSLPKLTI